MTCTGYTGLTGVATGPIFNLQKFDNMLIFTDWGRGTVSAFDTVTRSSKDLATGLMRPTSFSFYTKTILSGIFPTIYILITKQYLVSLLA